MVGLDSGDATVPVVTLSAVGADSAPRSTSLTYLLRCPSLISLSTMNFRLQHLLISCPNLCDNRIVRMGFLERGPSGSV